MPPLGDITRSVGDIAAGGEVASLLGLDLNGALAVVIVEHLLHHRSRLRAKQVTRCECPVSPSP